MSPSSKDLCSSPSSSSRPPHWDKNLKCFFLHHFDPFLLLNPFKIETKNSSPWSYLCHHVFSDEELDVFLSLASGRMYVPRELGHAQNSKRFYTNDGASQNIQMFTTRLQLMSRLHLLGPGHKSLNYQVLSLSFRFSYLQSVQI